MDTIQIQGSKKGWDRISTKPVGITIIMCLIAAIGNYAISYFAGFVLKLPIFLDTIFTITLLFYLGFLPAFFATFLYSIPSSLVVNAPFYILFNLCSLAILTITYFIMRYNERKNSSSLLTFLYLILASLVSAFASSVIGGIIHTFGLILYPDKAGVIVTEKFVISLFSKNGNLFLSSILGRIPTTCLDRVITTFAGWSLYKLLLKREKRFR